MSQVRDGWSTPARRCRSRMRAQVAALVSAASVRAAPGRGRLAADLGLNRATVSSLVTELRERGLIREGSAERGAVGVRARPSVDRRCGATASVRRDQRPPRPTLRSTWPAPSSASDVRSVGHRGLEPDRGGRRLVEFVQGTLADLAALGAAPVSAVVGVAGLVDHDRAHRLRRGQPRVQGRRAGQPAARQLGDPDYLLEVDNEANLDAVARPSPATRAPRHPRRPRRGRHRWRHRRRRRGPSRSARLRRRVRPHGRRPRRQRLRLRSHRATERPSSVSAHLRLRAWPPPATTTCCDCAPRPRGQGRGDRPPGRRRRRAGPGAR